jgi:hypothetical protein
VPLAVLEGHQNGDLQAIVFVTARRHHYVPQFYLRGFTRNGGKNSKLFVVDVVDRKSFWTTPANVCAVRDFNRIEAPGLPADALETSLGQFETVVARGLQTIIKDRATRDSKAWNCVLNLMSVMAVRNPHTRRQIDRYHSEILQLIARMTVQSPEVWDGTVQNMLKDGSLNEPPKVSYEQIKQFVDKGEYTISFPPGYHTPIEFGAQDVVLNTLADRKWLLLEAEAGEFITTDLPVCLLLTSGDAASLRHPIGHATRNTTILFPLSSDLIAMGSFEGQSGTGHADRKDVAAFNHALAMHCDFMLFARTDRFVVADRYGEGFATGAEVLNRIAASPRASRGRKMPR